MSRIPIRAALALGGGVVRRPALWPTAVRQVRRLARPGWWRRAPFLPIPPAGYFEFRMVTQYGDAAHRVEVDDVVKYLRWCREWERADRPA